MRRLIGLLLIIAGILLFLVNFNIVTMKSISNIIWPISLIIVGIWGIIIKKRLNLFDLELLVLGSIGLLISLGYLNNTDYGLILSPVILILIGISIVINRQHRRRAYTYNRNHTYVVNNKNKYNAMLRKRNYRKTLNKRSNM